MRHASLDFSYRRAPRGGVEEEQQLHLLSRTADLFLPYMLDRWVWSLEASRDFSMKLVCKFIDDILLPKEEVPTRLVNVIPIKINVFAGDFAWLMDSTSHIFFSCSMAPQVRSKVNRWWELDDTYIHSYEEGLLWFSNLRLSKRLKEGFEGVCYVMWWSIWRFRNRFLLEDSHPRRDILFDDIVQFSFP
nr:RNA-directed DNA polymerase, eukaryota [Tanacetum cinerariifolium]